MKLHKSLCEAEGVLTPMEEEIQAEAEVRGTVYIKEYKPGQIL